MWQSAEVPDAPAAAGRAQEYRALRPTANRLVEQLGQFVADWYAADLPGLTSRFVLFERSSSELWRVLLRSCAESAYWHRFYGKAHDQLTPVERGESRKETEERWALGRQTQLLHFLLSTFSALLS